MQRIRLRYVLILNPQIVFRQRTFFRPVRGIL